MYGRNLKPPDGKLMNKKIDLNKMLAEIEKENGLGTLKSQKLSQIEILEMMRRKKEERKK